jgi:hypothetical protein
MYFLSTTFARPRCAQRIAVRRRDGSYEISPSSIPYAPPRSDDVLTRIVELADGTRTMRELLGWLGFKTTLHAVEDLRLRATTSVSPMLVAASREKAHDT